MREIISINGMFFRARVLRLHRIIRGSVFITGFWAYPTYVGYDYQHTNAAVVCSRPSRLPNC